MATPAAGAARAQEEVQVRHWWPEHPSKSFFPGKPASCVLGVRNTGSVPINVTYALANLASPYNASMNLFNFTGSVSQRRWRQRRWRWRAAAVRCGEGRRGAVAAGHVPPAAREFGLSGSTLPLLSLPILPPARLLAALQYLRDVPLAAGEETSAEYNIFFPRQLPAREFVLKMTLVYTAGGQYRQAMFFNETINVIEEPTLFDTQLIGLYLMGLALLAAIGESRVWRCSRGGCYCRGVVQGPSSDAAWAGGLSLWFQQLHSTRPDRSFCSLAPHPTCPACSLLWC